MVTDAHTTGSLAVARSLSAAGMEVTVVREAGRFSLAAASRHADRVVTLPSVERHASLHLEGLLKEIRARAYDVLIPMTDSTIALLRRERQSVELMVRVALPPEDVLVGAQDKKVTVERARASGVRVPETRLFASIEEMRGSADGLQYPCVVKPRFSRQWDGSGPMTRGTVRYAYSGMELRRIFESSRQDPASLLVQEFVAGVGIGLFALMDNGSPRALFAHRRLREANPTGGRASLAESMPLEERVVAPAMRLLGALGWSGVAMVEFKDPGAPQAPVAMEVNGRFWGSLPLAIAAGVDFPLLAVQQLLGLPLSLGEGYRTGVKCRHLQGDLSYLVATFKGRPRGWSGPFPGRLEALASVTPLPGRWRPFNLRLSDPVPALGEAADFLRQAARSVARRVESRASRGAGQER